VSAALLIEGKLQPGGKMLVDADKLHELSVLLQQIESDKAELLEALRLMMEEGRWVGGDWVMDEATSDKAYKIFNKHRHGGK